MAQCSRGEDDVGHQVVRHIASCRLNRTRHIARMVVLVTPVIDRQHPAGVMQEWRLVSEANTGGLRGNIDLLHTSGPGESLLDSLCSRLGALRQPI